MSAPRGLQSDDVVRCGVISNAIRRVNFRLMYGVKERYAWITHIKDDQP